MSDKVVLKYGYGTILKNMKKILSILLFLPVLVSAHGTGGSFEKIDGEYFVDIGYSEPLLRAGESNRMDFQILKNTDKSDIDFNQVWVRVIKDGNLVFVATLTKPDFGLTGMTFTFPEAGTYDLTTSFMKNGEKILETSFDVPVNEKAALDEKGTITMVKTPFGGFVVGLTIGIVLSSLFFRKKKSQSTT